MPEPNIKILISCHKEIITPESNIFLPVHVGAQNAALPLKNAIPDNTGDNISERNFTFCELTAQYWAWKNLEADYYGLCHYRRYFYFEDKHYRANDHKQIEVDSLNKFTLKKYHLDDESLIRSCVTGNDVITPPYWNVKGTPTEDGPKKTIKEHMIGYGLIDEDGFELLESIVGEKQPSFKQDLLSYLNGSQYLGYNCYIMKKDLFFQLCDFEFSILFDFDKRFNYENRTTTQKRVCGYLGEILYSVFINHIKRTSRCKVAQYPMVFFKDTKPVLRLSNGESANTYHKTINIVWRFLDKSPEALATCITSLINHLSRSVDYHLAVLCNYDFEYNITQQLLPSIPENLSILQTTWQNTDLSSLGIEITEDELYDLYPLLLPWMENSSEPILWIDGITVFNDDPAALLEGKDLPFACGTAILTERELNRPKNKPVVRTYNAHDPKLKSVLSPSIVVISPAILRNNYELQYILDLYHSIFADFDTPKISTIKKQRFPQELPCSYLAAQSILYLKLGASALPISLVTQSINYDETQKWANESTFQQWKRSTDAKAINFRAENCPYLFPDPLFAPIFWKTANETNGYELLLFKMFRKRQNKLIDLLLPEESFGRKVVRKLITVIRH